MENTEVTKIPFEVTRVPDNTKPVGHEEVISDGVDGTRTVVSVDGHVTSDRTVAPKNEVVYYGTLEEEVPQSETEETAVVDTNPLPVVEPVKTDEVTVNTPPESNILTQTGSTMKTSVFKKALLEAGRLLVFAIPGILITVFTDNPSLGGSLGGTILLVLKSIDRSIHENPNTPVKGLLPF